MEKEAQQLARQVVEGNGRPTWRDEMDSEEEEEPLIKERMKEIRSYRYSKSSSPDYVSAEGFFKMYSGTPQCLNSGHFCRNPIQYKAPLIQDWMIKSTGHLCNQEGCEHLYSQDIFIGSSKCPHWHR